MIEARAPATPTGREFLAVGDAGPLRLTPRGYGPGDGAGDEDASGEKRSLARAAGGTEALGAYLGDLDAGVVRR